VKSDLIDYFLKSANINVPITLVTGVSDISFNQQQCSAIVNNPNIVRWIGCNILVSHPKIRKILVGVGEPGLRWGNHDIIKRVHSERIPWNEKKDAICIPYAGDTHPSRARIVPNIPKLDYEDYMREISKYKFVICPRGNGVDIFRFCDTLLMGSIPIVEHSPLDDMYSRFPCIIVDSFNTIDTSSFVWDDSKYETFLDTFWLREKLMEYLFD